MFRNNVAIVANLRSAANPGQPSSFHPNFTALSTTLNRTVHFVPSHLCPLLALLLKPALTSHTTDSFTRSRPTMGTLTLSQLSRLLLRAPISIGTPTFKMSKQLKPPP